MRYCSKSSLSVALPKDRFQTEMSTNRDPRVLNAATQEWYNAHPEVEEMTDEDAENLRLALDGIKIRGQDCPRPITKWSHCGLPASVYV